MYSHHLGKEFLLFLVFLGIFLAGCTKQPITPTSDGVIITSLSLDLDRIGTGSRVNIILVAENVGEAAGRNIIAELVGLDDWTIKEREHRSNVILSPADLELNAKGGEDFVEWETTTPSFKGSNQKYDFSAKLYYSYETLSTILLQSVNLDYFRTLNPQQQAQVNPGIFFTSTKNGPLVISAKSPAFFPGQTKELPVEIEIKNVGSGRAFEGGEKPDRNTVDKIIVNVKGAVCEKGSEKIKLANSKTGRLVCKLDVSNVESFKIFPIEITITYRYFVEKTSSVTVLKSIESIEKK